MPLPESFTQQEVNEAVSDLKAFIEDTGRDGGSFKTLERDLPRLAYLLANNKVLACIIGALPKETFEIQDEDEGFYWMDFRFPAEPKARLSKQLTILREIGSGKQNVWDISRKLFGELHAADFWSQVFYPATRDLKRHIELVQKDFMERKKSQKNSRSDNAGRSPDWTLDLFISHSSKNKRLAKAMIKFLCTALSIPHKKVRCTSVSGYKLPGGAKIEGQLSKEILDARCFIALITPASLESQFVLFELGARWGSEKHFVPILAKGMNAWELKPPLSNLNALNSADKNDMEQLVHDLAGVMNKRVPQRSIYEAELSTLIKLGKAINA